VNTFTVKVERTDVYTAEVDVAAETAQEAAAIVDAKLEEDGWDGVFDGDGDYEECISEILCVKFTTIDGEKRLYFPDGNGDGVVEVAFIQ
jgi:hypothetical protein